MIEDAATIREAAFMLVRGEVEYLVGRWIDPGLPLTAYRLPLLDLERFDHRGDVRFRM